MQEPWCVLGDFNSILYTGDRIKGTEIMDSEVKHFTECIAECELQEMRNCGPYFTWTNKTVWSRSDRVFVKTFWFDQFDCSHNTYMENSLSDHNSMVIDFSGWPKPESMFQFCDIWVRDPSFQ